MKTALVLTAILYASPAFAEAHFCYARGISLATAFVSQVFSSKGSEFEVVTIFSDALNHAGLEHDGAVCLSAYSTDDLPGDRLRLIQALQNEELRIINFDLPPAKMAILQESPVVVPAELR